MHERRPAERKLHKIDAESDEIHERRHPPGLALDPPDEPPPNHPPEIPPERLDADALKVIARLRHMHHQAYLVGGCVRDLLLGATPKDFDVATDAHPGEVRAVFRNCRLIGRRFRLAHVYFRGGKVIEVATFRKNPVDVAEDVPDGGDLLITRDNVFGTAQEDAVRRDFTVNGLFYDVARAEVIDYVGGRADLEANRIATIGDPEIRMREDPVRALRAVRFAARLGFTIAPDTFEAMRRHAAELGRCAPARVLEETFKILRCGRSARAFELLRACGALQVVLPALSAAQDGWDDARRRSFFVHLGALDRLVRSGEDVSDAVLLGALLVHLGPGASAAGSPAGADPGHDEGANGSSPPHGRGPGGRRRSLGSGPADLLLASLVQTSRLPRKIAERTRLALHAQRMLRDPPRRRRRRGRGLSGQPYFDDARQLLWIVVEATGEGRELLERWTSSGGPDGGGEPAPRAERGRDAHAEGGEREPLEVGEQAGAAGDAEPEGGAEEQAGIRRRRRRRGGRRRRRRGAGAPAGATPSA